MTTKVSETKTQDGSYATESGTPPDWPAPDSSRNDAPATPPPGRRRRKRSKRGLILLTVVVAAIALLVWYIFINRPAQQGAEKLVVATGKIASNEATVSAKTAGRVR